MSDPASTANGPAARHDCRLVSEYHGSVRVVRVIGCLDWTTADEFRDLLRDECTDAMVVIDLAATTRMDSTGTGDILSAAARMNERGQQLALVVTDPLQLEVLTETGLGTLVPVVPSVSEALLRLEAPDGP